ncbi:MAG: bifunctional phosphopantothenoylcysteine decarboxylase/phosphopantothenate--cysteine ligase CoaBC [Flavobacteriales bacterium]|nr:bifunctional phosphopantothenoylcysteine decarboxylase/phosphopantothenate--cysteine ligase CoaBC [Flavobacteriales bacterium]
MLNGKNILLGVTGGIAAYKTATLIRLFKKSGAHVKVIMTPEAKEFITPLTLSTLAENPVISSFTDEETGLWENHVEHALWADLFVVAPATANTIAKMTQGICDNFLMATYLSAKCPVYVCPAMDLDMYKHPTTQENLKQLVKNGNRVIDAAEGELASGLVGKGRMEEPENIFAFIENDLRSGLKLYGKKVLVTAGPTHEKIDAVRFIGNNSSGKMGFELAERAAALGADVCLVAGPVKLALNDQSIRRINIESANEMHQAVMQEQADADIIVMAAAVADYTPEEAFSHKLKKKEAELSIRLKPTQDILAALGRDKKNNQLLVGFALETDNELEHAKEKLAKKNLDFIVLNSLKDVGAGFDYDTNKITIIDRDNKTEEFELKSKSEVARDILNKIISLLG